MDRGSIEAISGKGIINSFSDPLIVINKDFQIILANNALISYLGITEDDILLKDVSAVVSGLVKEDTQWDSIERTSDGMVREAALSFGAIRIDVMITISPLVIDGVCMGYILLFRDMRSVKELMASLKSAYNNMSNMIVRDPMTGLFNRGHFNERIEDFYNNVNSGQNSFFTFFMFDIDHFKDVNDNLGHQVGDEVIKAITAKAKAYFCGCKGEVFRYGGEEFVAMSNLVSQDMAFATADELRRLVEEETPFPQGIKVTISMGVLTYSLTNKAEIPSVDVLIRRVDKALYEAKDGGRNQVRSVVFSNNAADDAQNSFEDEFSILL